MYLHSVIRGKWFRSIDTSSAWAYLIHLYTCSGIYRHGEYDALL